MKKQVMFSVREVIELINEGKKLLLAGDEELLKQLPKGSWIGGTIPYFMAERGGIMSQQLIFVNEIPNYVSEIKCTTYTTSTIENIYSDGYDNGLTVVIIPSKSDVHHLFANKASEYDNFAIKPLIGWISGVAMNVIDKINAKVFMGETGESFSDKAVSMHIKLPLGKYADIHIRNIFEQKEEGDIITFPKSGFDVDTAIINGESQNFADYIIENNIDTRLPLVANYNGTMINVSIQSVNNVSKKVHLYAPVFENVEYIQAAPIYDYVKRFSELFVDAKTITPLFSCNCILNYLYSELENKKTAGITGPITFGEIAYQLLNQTLVDVEIKDV